MALGRAGRYVILRAGSGRFVVFGLGGNSAPKGTKPYTAQEVARLRTQALATQSLMAAREDVVGEMLGRCNVPKSMNYFYDGQGQAAR